MGKDVLLGGGDFGVQELERKPVVLLVGRLGAGTGQPDLTRESEICSTLTLSWRFASRTGKIGKAAEANSTNKESFRQGKREPHRELPEHILLCLFLTESKERKNLISIGEGPRVRRKRQTVHSLA